MIINILAKSTSSNNNLIVKNACENLMDSQVKTWEELLDEYSLRDIYKEEYEKVTIKDEDIEYLHNTLIRIISLFSSFGNVTEEQTVSFQQMAELLNKDTLKTMQLLGFNYREAIGEPLTEVCANTIKSKLGNL